MRNATAAEWILSLATTPDRAASTVGDLLEEASARGVFWFWSSVLRTASSHLWRDLRAAPLRILGLAFSGLLAYLVLIVCLGFIESGVWSWVYYGSGGDQAAIYMVGVYIIVALTQTAVGFLVGWFVAQRSKGRELLAALVVVALLAALYAENLYRSVMQAPRIGRPLPGFELAVFCALALSVIAGAIRFRRRTLA